ncbi:MAG: DNA-processing protein DprA [Minisyncoccia bacterium]|jgi:DNA processing protein
MPHREFWFLNLEPTIDNKMYLNALNIIFQDKMMQLAHFLLGENSLKDAYTKALKINDIKINIEKEWQKLEQNNINFLLYNDPLYPSLLKEIDAPPLAIYFKGKLPQNQFYISIVGTRKISSYGKAVLEKIIPDLIKFNFVTISGLALGSDTYCHKLTLDFYGKTIAVLGSGLNCIYPTINKNLAEKISENGALISELPLEAKALKYNFPWRNRIISGLSPATLIIEAPFKSGSLITARFALEQNRDVLVIPGSIFNENSYGNNKLIQEGAKLINSIEDILEEYNIQYEKQQNVIQFDNDLEKQIYTLFLENEVLTVDKILENIKLNIDKVLPLLTNLEIKGMIKNIGYEKYRKQN